VKNVNNLLFYDAIRLIAERTMSASLNLRF